MHEKKIFDLAIIGSGPGGYTAAIRASQKGLSVAIIEKALIGGVCLNVGCIPTKAIITSSEITDCIKKAEAFGLEDVTYKVNLSKIIKHKDKVVERIRKNIESLIQSNKVTIYKGTAKFLSPTDLEIVGIHNLQISAKHIIIATGSLPRELDAFLCDHKHLFNSTSILSHEKLPQTLAIIGGGYIGCEYASFFARLGVKVTIIEALDSLIRSQGKVLSDALSKAFVKQGIFIKTKTKVEKIEYQNGNCKITTSDNAEQIVDLVLISVGRVPNTEDLDLKKANVTTNEHGFITVDDYFQTNVKNIYAIGDVIGKSMLAHAAAHQGLLTIDNILGKKEKMNYDHIPAVVYTKPEIASIGLNLEEAKQKNINAEKTVLPYLALGIAYAKNDEDGFLEIVFDKNSKKILGAFICGYGANFLISEISLAITNNLTIDDLANTIHPHPSFAESIPEIGMLSQNFPINFPRSK